MNFYIPLEDNAMFSKQATLGASNALRIPKNRFLRIALGSCYFNVNHRIPGSIAALLSARVRPCAVFGI